MYIKMKTGPRIGEIQDVVFTAAKSLIEQGLAEKVDFDARDNQPTIISPATTAIPQAAGAIAKKRRKI